MYFSADILEDLGSTKSFQKEGASIMSFHVLLTSRAVVLAKVMGRKVKIWSRSSVGRSAMVASLIYVEVIVGVHGDGETLVVIGRDC